MEAYNNFETGDIVFIYNSRLDSQILYKMEVTAINLTSDVTTADRQYWATPSEFDASLAHNRFFRMILLAENKTEKLTLSALLSNILDNYKLFCNIKVNYNSYVIFPK